MTLPKNHRTPQKLSWALACLLSATLLSYSTSFSWARKNQTLRICDDIQAPPTLDPHKQFTEKNHTLLQQIFEGLVRFGPKGNIKPSLAVSWKRIDPLTMEFKLRKRVQFHNGEPFNSTSVQFSIDRYLNPKTGFPALGFISSIKKVEVIDSHTIWIRTHYPDGLLLNRLAGYVLIVPKNFVKKNGENALNKNPIGTGPFQFDRWLKNKKGIQLKRNASYWDAKRPHVEGLVFHFIPADEQVEALLNDEIDILTTLPGTQTLVVQKHPDAYVIKKPTFFTVAGNFNLDRKPTSIQRVRQALNLAVNKADLIRYDLLGNGRPIAAMSMPGQFGHNESLKPYPFDLSKAMKILEEEGYADGFKLNVLVKADGKRMAQIVAKHLKRIGVKLKFTVVPDAELIQSLQNKSRWDMVIGDFPDPLHHSYFISAAFLYSKSPFSLSVNQTFDKKLEALVVTIDEKEQEKQAQELDRFIHEQALGLFGYQQIRTFGIRKGVEFEPYESGMHYFDQASKKESLQ